MKTTFIALLLFFTSSMFAQEAYLVRDINFTTNADASSSYPRQFFRFGSRIFFFAYAPDAGFGLWATDGTESGTSKVVSLQPGAQSTPSEFTIVNGNLVFNTRDGRGDELWVTDGTAAGTRLMADIYTGSRSSSPGARIVHAGKMIFVADDGVDGRELWITDGTPAGTRFFKDLVPGPNGSDPHSFVSFNGSIYFFAADSLWKSDGTAEGTVVVKPLDGSGLVVVGSRMFLQAYTADAGSEPWVSDGTEAGTQRIMDLRPGSEGSFQYLNASFTAFGNRVLFTADDGQHGAEWWLSDGTAAGTRMLRDIDPDGSGAQYPAILVRGNTALFAARTPEAGIELWKTDGTSEGTVLVRDLIPGPIGGSPTRFIELNGAVYFTAANEVVGEVWVTDGTAEGTRLVMPADTRLTVGSSWTKIDGMLYFSGANRLNGQELWKSDGTAAGTVMVKNIALDPAPSSTPAALVPAEDWVYFRAWDGSEPASSSWRGTLWRSDGTSEGTIELGDFVLESYGRLTVGRSVYFLGPDSLWVTDGTTEGTQPAEELEARFPSRPTLRHLFGDTLFVESNNALWTTSIAPGSPAEKLGEFEAKGFTEVAGRVVYFTSVSDTAVWITDGTQEGTRVVRAVPDHNVGTTAVMSGHVFFRTFNPNSKLWKTDGTADGTIGLTLPKGGDLFHPAGTKMFFKDGSGGELWVTDGTQDGTRELPAKVQENEMAVAGGTLVFTAASATQDTELWTSDGTPDGTRLLVDLYPGAFGSRPSNLTAAGGLVYFTATTPLTGTELWVTDGTAAGTKLAADIEPGSGSSRPENLVVAGERLYFTARTSATGSELWAIPLPSTPRLAVKDVRLAEADTMARFTITLSSPSTQTVTVDYATTNGTAAAGSDYDAAAGTITFAAGETLKHIDVHVREDASSETNETFSVTLRNPVSATLETIAATAIVEDDDRTADVALALDFSSLHSRAVGVKMKNAGPASATNLQPKLSVMPADVTAPPQCYVCPFMTLEPNAEARAFGQSTSFHEQQYVTATVVAEENDPNPANNALAWTTHNVIAMDAHSLTPGSQANIWVDWYQSEPSVTIVSSNPAVVAVPSSISVPGNAAVSFVARGLAAGTATIRVSTGTHDFGRLEVEVLPPGVKKRWPGAFRATFNTHAFFHQQGAVWIETVTPAPFTNQTATGEVIVTADGVEVGRGMLTADTHGKAIPFHLPEIGEHAMSIQYAGDANFLPQTQSWTLTVVRGRPTIEATATRKGTDVIVRARISGSSQATPTGSLRIGVLGAATTDVPIQPHGPGRGFVELTLTGVVPQALTVSIAYSGDSHYQEEWAYVPISEERRRGVRH